MSAMNGELPGIKGKSNSPFCKGQKLFLAFFPSVLNFIVQKNFLYHCSHFLRHQEKLPRSSSIDSMVDVVWNIETDSNLVTLPKLLMVQETSSRRESLLSPRRTKQSRGINCKILLLILNWFCV